MDNFYGYDVIVWPQTGRKYCTKLHRFLLVSWCLPWWVTWLAVICLTLIGQYMSHDLIKLPLQFSAKLSSSGGIPSEPSDKLYKQIITSNGPVNPFLSTDQSIGETVSVWTLFSHAGIYVMAIGLLLPTGLGIFCCYFFWCQPARLVCGPLQSGSTQYTIVNDNVEKAPIYRWNRKAGSL